MRVLSYFLSLQGVTKTSMLRTKSMRRSAQLPEQLTVRNSQKQMMAKAARICTPFKVVSCRVHNNSILPSHKLIWPLFFTGVNSFFSIDYGV